VDFWEALVVIGGVEQKGHFLCMDLPHSDDCFVMAFPAECSPSSGASGLILRNSLAVLRSSARAGTGG
jgi:hypothetical protein